MATIEAKDGSSSIRVELNYAKPQRYEDPAKEDRAFFIKTVNNSSDLTHAVLSIDGAKQLQAKLGALIAEFEDNKPKIKTVPEQVEELKVGTLFSLGADQAQYARVKTGAFSGFVSLHSGSQYPSDDARFFSEVRIFSPKFEEK